jgi:hypothetical protein
MNKKGSLTDSIMVPLYLLILAATTFIGVYVWLAFQNGMTLTLNNSPWLSVTNNQTITNSMTGITVALRGIDYMFPLLVIGLLIVSLIFAFKTGASVVYAFVSIILWGLALLLAAVYSNIFETFVTAMPTIAVQYPIMVYLLSNIKWIVLIWLFLISVIMFTRTKREDQSLAAAETVFG